MPDNPPQTAPVDTAQGIPLKAESDHHGILDQTLGEVLQHNPQAQGMIMKTMHITPEKFQEMLQTAEKNELMHMKIGDLFKQGIVQKAVSQPGNQQTQVSPEQLQQVTNIVNTSEVGVQTPQKSSFLQRLKSLFK